MPVALPESAFEAQTLADASLGATSYRECSLWSVKSAEAMAPVSPELRDHSVARTTVTWAVARSP
jgi:hypothetical protein